jgi:DNA-binding GntR family transcriptional regulator
VTGIASGVLVPGQRLIEVELAGMLQMSRVPLREALKILEVQGILKSTPHRGTVVLRSTRGASTGSAKLVSRLNGSH